MTGRESSGGGRVGQESEQNERRSEDADHKVGLGRKYVQVLWKDGVQREHKKWKNTEKVENNGVTCSWIGAELTPKQMQEVLCLL